MKGEGERNGDQILGRRKGHRENWTWNLGTLLLRTCPTFGHIQSVSVIRM